MESRVLERVGRMPFCSLEDLAGTLLLPLKAVRETIYALRDLGMVELVYLAPVRGGVPARYVLTRHGAETLARRKRVSVDDLMQQGFMLSVQQVRAVMRRISNVELFYGLTAAAAAIKGKPCVWHWRREGWMEGTLEVGVGEGRLMRVLRVGKGMSRTGIRSKLGSMVEDWRDSVVNTFRWA